MGKTTRKQKLTSIIMYGVIIATLFFPWITPGDSRYNLVQFVLKMKEPGLETMVALSGAYVENIASLRVAIWLEIGVFFLVFMFGIAYIVTVIKEKDWKFNAVTVCLVAIGLYINNIGMGSDSLSVLCSDEVMCALYPDILLALAVAEFIVSKAMEQWTEMNAEAKAIREKERQKKEEKKRRLFFKGNYNNFFYRLIWKNFKSTWKDYVLLLGCSSMVFCFIIIGYGLQKMLSSEHRYRGIQLFDGLNAILVNAIIPLGVISIFIIIILSFYYLRCRAKSYGVFLTLGMRRKTLNYFIALEFVSLLVITFILGGVLGTGVLYLFSLKSEALLEVHIGMSTLGILVYIKSVGTILMIYLISFMAMRDIFMDFNVGKSNDLRAVKERIPHRCRKIFLAIGVMICAYSIFEYRQLRNFENVYLLLAFMVGYILVLRYGMLEYLLRERKGKGYLKKLMIHNQLFHKSRTNTAYIFALTVILFCTLFYFSFQMLSVEIAEDGDNLYPYDIMCIADDEDDDIFSKLQEDYETEIYSYPMVRVSNYDSTEKVEGIRDPDPIQGQNIGISESTYHALKKQLDPSYQAKPLGLDAEGERVYIVHQQDKSVKAQPVDFYLNRKTPLLHVGLPCENLDVYRVKKRDLGYYYKTIQGEEIGSLTGVFRQGLRENLIVFSDEYFEVVKDDWKTRDALTGELLDERSGIWSDVESVTVQGPTRLVLINADGKDISGIEDNLAELKERHADEEFYDGSVSSYYVKQDALKDLKTERVMKSVMNLLVLIAFFLIYFVLAGVKMLTEIDAGRRRADFLSCLGMRRKIRIRLARQEIFRYCYILPAILAVLFALVFTMSVFHARMYQPEDIRHYLDLMFPLWGICLVSSGVVMWCLTTIYAHKVEVEDGKKQ